MATAAHMGCAANLFALVADLFPKPLVGSVVGLGVMFGSITAMAFSQLTGLILQATGSYWPLFILAGSAYLLALMVMHVLTPRMTPVEFEVDTKPKAL